MAIKPYQLKLKKVSKHRQALLKALFAYLPATGVRERFDRGVRDAISAQVNDKCTLRLEALHEDAYSQFINKLPDPSLLVVLGMAPLSGKAILEIDFSLAMMLIERILGGDSNSVPDIRELSDTEQGVMQYLILKVLEGVHTSCGNSERVLFRFERFAFRAHELEELVSGDDGVVTLVYRLNVGKRSGFVRLSLPDPFMKEAFLNVEAPDEIRKEERDYMIRNLRRFRSVDVSLWAEAGRSSLVGADIEQLEEGDIILFDRSSVSLVDGKTSGKTILRVGDGRRGAFDAEFLNDGGGAKLKILGAHKGD